MISLRKPTWAGDAETGAGEDALRTAVVVTCLHVASTTETEMGVPDSDLIEACTAVLAIEEAFFPLLSQESLRSDVGGVVECLVEAQAPHVERICARSAGTWGGLLAKARAALPWSADPADPCAPANERLLGALLRDIESAAQGRETEALT